MEQHCIRFVTDDIFFKNNQSTKSFQKKTHPLECVHLFVVTLFYFANSSFTSVAINFPSAFPANFEERTPITLPISCGPFAPV